MESVMVLYLEF